MKQKIVIITTLLCSIFMTGCTKQKDPDYMMLCSFHQEDAEGIKDGQAFFTYVEETKETVTGEIKMDYDGFAKNEVNNQELTNLTIRKSIFDDVEGVSIELYRTDTTFGISENWEYRKVDKESIVHTDEVQKQLIDEEQAIFHIDKIKQYYEFHGYECSISNR